MPPPDSDAKRGDRLRLAALAEEEDAARVAFYAEHSPKAQLTAERRGVYDEAGWDLALEAVALAYEQRETIRPLSRIPKWIALTVRRLAANYWRAQAKARERAAPWELAEQVADDHPDALALLIEEQQRRFSRSVFARLSQDDQELITMREQENMPLWKMAEELDLAEGTVSSRLFRARERLGELVVQARAELKRRGSL
jgi:RNA polymerase sigma factor (sigma-70 family)